MLSNRFGESIQQRNTGVKGEECDGTLRECVAAATKQGGTAGISIYSLSLELLRKAKQLQDRLFCITICDRPSRRMLKL